MQANIEKVLKRKDRENSNLQTSINTRELGSPKN